MYLLLYIYILFRITVVTNQIRTDGTTTLSSYTSQSNFISVLWGTLAEAYIELNDVQLDVSLFIWYCLYLAALNVCVCQKNNTTLYVASYLECNFRIDKFFTSFISKKMFVKLFLEFSIVFDWYGINEMSTYWLFYLFKGLGLNTSWVTYYVLTHPSTPHFKNFHTRKKNYSFKTTIFI